MPRNKSKVRAALVGTRSARHRCWHRNAGDGDCNDQGGSGTGRLNATADLTTMAPKATLNAPEEGQVGAQVC